MKKMDGMSIMIRRAAFILAWLGWMSIMFYFSSKAWSGVHTRSLLEEWLKSLSLQQVKAINLIIRKLAHFAEYSVLTWLGFYAWSVGFQQPRNRALLLTVLCSVIYAIADEIHQSFVPGRNALLIDILIDLLGALAAFWLIKRWPARLARTSRLTDKELR